MSVSVTQILIQQGYLTTEQYNYAYQLQQQEPVDTRKPLLQIYLEQEFLGLEHIEYCLALKQQYIQQGDTMEAYPAVESYSQEPVAAPSAGGAVTCKACLSECQSSWAACPFCGTPL